MYLFFFKRPIDFDYSEENSLKNTLFMYYFDDKYHNYSIEKVYFQ